MKSNKFFSMLATVSITSLIAATGFAEQPHQQQVEKKECKYHSDNTCSGILDSNEVVSVSVRDIPKGSFDLQVFSSNPHALFTCTFYDGAGNTGRVQQWVPTCSGAFSLNHKDFIRVKVENASGAPVDYRVDVLPY